MDYLLSFSRNPTTAGLVRTLGLRGSLPPVLRRANAARTQRLLNDVRVVAGAMRPAHATAMIAGQLAAMGARVVWTGTEPELALFTPGAEAWAEPVVHLPLKSADSNEGVTKSYPRVYGLVFDATGIRTEDDLNVLYTFFNTWLNQLSSGGRVVVLAHPPDCIDRVMTDNSEGGATTTRDSLAQALARANIAALWQGLDGLVRSLGKELGRKGSTANLVWIEPGAEARAAGPLRFLLSDYSAFITSQPLRVSNSVRETASQRRHFDRPLSGKVALVTGASRGIGRATAQALANEGARVAIVEHPSAAAEASVAARELGADSLLLDISAPGAAQKLAAWMLETFGWVDVVVHNAGITRDKTLARMSFDAWSSVLNVNLVAALALTRVLFDEGLLRNDGRIISLASVGGIAGNVGQTNYAFSKAGMIGWTRTLSVHLAERGITVNAVAPGFIETQMTAKMPTMIREAARRLSALNQGGLPEDVAQAVTFLALPDSVGLTGNVLRVCGGALIGA
jgi:3-oxoacyl-[acyl-carrier protein] reductase